MATSTVSPSGKTHERSAGQADKPGATAADLDASLKDHVKATVGMWKYPRWVEVRESLPKTATGKIQRFKLRDEA